ncbi:hypothetical protein B9C88_17555 [Brevibacillus laterosporus]|uniref:anti-sigma-F factor Fin family protein n=1 Tax=Brevibacillus laterosporus TaxID=1465 RepID=UPI000BDA4CF4|nr:anti-sigma-F factor Fin family protein [Brevibacillus laterosporus]PCN43027.1 hypothetical protein B9C88_17555 [Brevibacillus laterosporus]
MSYRYVCRCCGMKVGEIQHSNVSEWQLGFQFLTQQERQHIISKDEIGNTVVRVVCDYCKEALDQNPDLSVVGNPLQ